MRVARAASGARSADAEIVDDAGAIVADRTVTDKSARTCTTLARAIGAWATLVIDAEMNRAHDDDGGARRADAPRDDEATTGGADGTAVSLPRRAGDDDPDHAPAAPPKRMVELGGSIYVRGGLLDSGGVAGLSPSIAIEVTEGWLARPSFFFGRARDATLAHVGGRFDFCRRIPGNYIDRHGIQLDVCGGADLGGVPSDSRAPFALRASVGPSAALRGELGAGFAIELRGLAGVNLIDAQPLTGAAELGLSMRLP
jgi:hypothetical protein